LNLILAGVRPPWTNWENLQRSYNQTLAVFIKEALCGTAREEGKGVR